MKIKSLQYILALSIFTVVFSNSLIAQQTADSIIFNAMHDEMQRSMQIQNLDYPSPNFISYTLMFQNLTSIVSKQGALFSSMSQKYSDASLRLTVGNYQLNDENFDDRTNGGIQDFFSEIAKPPISPDYDGIRNIFWILTNSTYHRATNSYKNKNDVIKKYNLGDGNNILPDFSTEDVVNFSETRNDYFINKPKLEQKSRIYSSVFKNYPEIKYAEARINIIQNDYYFLNTEGSRFRFPMDITQLFVNVKSDFSGENNSSGSLLIYSRSPDELPSDKEVVAEIKKLVQNINKVSKAESLKEDYSGPILFEGNLVGDILFSNLFSFGFSLNAWRNDLVLENSNKVYFAEISNKLQFKIGEQIFPKHITIISYSKRKEYKGHKLLGSYNIDAEGVIPADSLIMVKNGILKNLYSSRLPTNISEKSSGRRRYSFNRNQIGVRSGPGTLHFKSSAATSIDELKSRLIRMAKDQGFKYAYILRSIPSKIANLSANCYQVDVETGKEILVDDIALRYKLKRQVLKNLVGVSDSTFIYNSLWNNDRKNMGQNSVAETGLLVSLIIPSAILVDNAEIRTQTSNKNLNLKQEEISNPLERSY